MSMGELPRSPSTQESAALPQGTAGYEPRDPIPEFGSTEIGQPLK